MAISSDTYAPLSYAGDDSTTAFSVTWQFFDGTIKVTEISSTGAETVKALTTDYAVSGGTDSDGLPATGTVTAVSAPASGVTWRIERVTPKTNAAGWPKSGPFSAKTLEAQLDRTTLVGQELSYQRAYNWRTAWVVDTVYSASDVVTHNGNVYLCIAAHTSASTDEPGIGANTDTYWDLLLSSSATGGLVWEFNTATSGDPGSGKFLLNNATLSSVSSANISDNEVNGVDVSAFIATWDDSTSSPKARLVIRNQTDLSSCAIYSITGASSDESGYYTLALTHVASSGTLADHCSIEWIGAGDGGSDGRSLATQGAWATSTAYVYSTSQADIVENNGSSYICKLSHTSSAGDEPGVGGSWATYWNLFASQGASGAGSGDLIAANNLSDVNSASASATNLGLGTSDSPQFAGVNVGHATDTTITRTGAGTIAVEGNEIYRAGGTDVPVVDGGTGASTATAGFDNLSPTTTKGDVIANDGTNNVRLAVGANNKVLVADSAESAGVKWGNVSVSALADGTDGELITWDASGVPTTVAVGTSGQVLTSNGTGAAPTFQTASGGTAPTVQVFTSSGTWTKPTDCRFVKVTVTGGGGGSGGIDISCATVRTGGGGGGATAIKWIDVTAISSETVTVGAGGSAGASGPSETSGGAGGDSTFGAHCTGGGGSGSSSSTGSSSNGASGGTASNGDVNMSGGSGGDGDNSGGAGGASFMSAGGSLDGEATGKAYGGGGDGIETTSDTAGRAGGAGIVIVEEFY